MTNHEEQKASMIRSNLYDYSEMHVKGTITVPSAGKTTNLNVFNT